MEADACRGVLRGWRFGFRFGFSPGVKANMVWEWIECPADTFVDDIGDRTCPDHGGEQ